MPVITATEEGLRTCRRCGQEKTIDSFPVTKSPCPSQPDRRYRMHLCLTCVTASKRNRERMNRDPECRDSIAEAVDAAPDPSPAVALRQELALQRDSGRPWRSAWPCARGVVLEDLQEPERASWREVFSATQREWQANFEGTATGPRLSLPER